MMVRVGPRCCNLEKSVYVNVLNPTLGTMDSQIGEICCLILCKIVFNLNLICQIINIDPDISFGISGEQWKHFGHHSAFCAAMKKSPNVREVLADNKNAQFARRNTREHRRMRDISSKCEMRKRKTSAIWPTAKWDQRGHCDGLRGKRQIHSRGDSKIIEALACIVPSAPPSDQMRLWGEDIEAQSQARD